MTQLLLDLSDDLAGSVAATQEGLAAEVRLMAALKLFELGRLASGQAAELAGLSRAGFLEACGRYRVSGEGPALESLADILAGVTPQNVHSEVATGAAVGEESW